MVFFKQLLAILSLSLLAELGSIYLRPYIFIPAPIVGILLLILLLKLNIFKENFLNAIAPNFVYHMSIFLIPAAVGMIKYYTLIKKHILFFSICIIITSALTLTLTALASNFMTRFFKNSR